MGVKESVSRVVVLETDSFFMDKQARAYTRPFLTLVLNFFNCARSASVA